MRNIESIILGGGGTSWFALFVRGNDDDDSRVGVCTGVSGPLGNGDLVDSRSAADNLD